MTWSTSDIAAARATLSRATAGEVSHVFSLTDEEIVVLDGVQHAQLVTTPYLDGLTDAERDLAPRVALRSLVVRDLVSATREPDPADPDGEPAVGLTAVEEITGPLVLRRTADAICTIERTTTLGKHWVYLYRHEGDVVLEEEVSVEGAHAFSVYPADVARARVADFLDPARSAVLDTRARTLTREELTATAAQDPALASALDVSTIAGVVAGSDRVEVVTVYTTADAVHVLRGSEHDDAGDPATFSLQEASRATLEGLADEVLRR